MLPIRRLVYVWSPGHGSLPRRPRWRTGLAIAISIGPNAGEHDDGNQAGVQRHVH
jgi:hypothetical protein